MPIPHKPHPPATDAMTCRACGQEERASEGYPCMKCGTFICVVCAMRGVSLCRACSASAGPGPSGPPSGPPVTPQTPRA